MYSFKSMSDPRKCEQTGVAARCAARAPAPLWHRPGIIGLTIKARGYTSGKPRAKTSIWIISTIKPKNAEALLLQIFSPCLLPRVQFLNLPTAFLRFFSVLEKECSYLIIIPTFLNFDTFNTHNAWSDYSSFKNKVIQSILNELCPHN